MNNFSYKYVQHNILFGNPSWGEHMGFDVQVWCMLKDSMKTFLLINQS